MKLWALRNYLPSAIFLNSLPILKQGPKPILEKKPAQPGPSRPIEDRRRLAKGYLEVRKIHTSELIGNHSTQNRSK